VLLWLNVSGENNIARVNGSEPHHHEATSISSVLMAWDVMMFPLVHFSLILPLQAGADAITCYYQNISTINS
jgi:hypothetical protein